MRVLRREAREWKASLSNSRQCSSMHLMYFVVDDFFLWHEQSHRYAVDKSGNAQDPLVHNEDEQQDLGELSVDNQNHWLIKFDPNASNRQRGKDHVEQIECVEIRSTLNLRLGWNRSHYLCLCTLSRKTPSMRLNKRFDYCQSVRIIET